MRTLSLLCAVGFVLVSSFLCSRAESNGVVCLHDHPCNVSALPSKTARIVCMSLLLTTRDEHVDKRLDANDPDLKYATQSVHQWHRRVLDPLWQPTEDAIMTFNRGNEGHSDTIITMWVKNGYRLKTVQTVSRLIIVVAPDMGDTGTDPVSRIEFAKRLCVQVFPDAAFRRTGQGERRNIRNLSKRISEVLFKDPENCLIEETSITCGPSTPKNDRRLDTYSSEERERLQLVDESNDDDEWMASEFRYNYWFGNITWWNNGMAVGFTVLKKTGGPAEIDSEYDNGGGWFLPATRVRSQIHAKNGNGIKQGRPESAEGAGGESL